MNPDESAMLAYLYRRERRRERVRFMLATAFVIAAVLVGGVAANVWMYQHGWK